MGKFIAGDIVVIPFPYTDLTQFKKRPALVLKELGNDDYLLAMITSKSYNSPYSLPVIPSVYSSGSLPSDSFVRCNRLFEANDSIIIKKAASLSSDFTRHVIHQLIEFLKTE
jgi:mRNA interferase MazF